MINVFYIHQYATLPELNGHLRPYLFAKNMKDFNFTIICSSYQHFTGDNFIKDRKQYRIVKTSNATYCFVKVKTPKKGIFGRIGSMFAFSKKAKRIIFKALNNKDIEKPNIIIASSPDIMVFKTGIATSKKLSVPCICEVRDLWPENLFNDIKHLKEKGILGRFLVSLEHKFYKKADSLIFTKEGDTDYLKEKRWTTDQGGDINLSKCFYINNGVDLEKYAKDIESSSYSFNSQGKLVVTYAGAIRGTNNIFNIVKCAAILRNESDIVFHIFGGGNDVEKMLSMIEELKLNNIKYMGYAKKSDIPKILSYSSINLLNYGDNYNWTRGNSSNKLFEYMASGKPIISSVKMGYSLIEKYNCGFEMNDNTPEELANCILRIRDLDSLSFSSMCEGALAGANDFDYKKLAKKLQNAIEKTIKGDFDND